MEKFLITGANGFIGSRLCQALENRSVSFVPCVRRLEKVEQYTVAPFENGSLTGNVDWKPALAGCDVVVHLAARVHVMQEGKGDPWPAYRAANVDATMRLAEQAASRASGDLSLSAASRSMASVLGAALSADDVPGTRRCLRQVQAGGRAALQTWSARTGTELVIVRPPLVYGPGVRANFCRLMQLVKSGVPLPLGGIRNRRSMVGLGNLVDFLLLCAKHPALPATWMVSDNHDLSTCGTDHDLLPAMGRPARLLPVPRRLRCSRLAPACWAASRPLAACSIRCRWISPRHQLPRLEAAARR
jgi:nucleoside-diphosphate-sugar epimerase